MCNEYMNPINTTDGWEEIVNRNCLQRSFARERVAARKRERKIKKLKLATCVLASISIVSVILGSVGFVADWLATFIAIGNLVSASILFGRYVEAKK